MKRKRRTKQTWARIKKLQRMINDIDPPWTTMVEFNDGVFELDNYDAAGQFEETEVLHHNQKVAFAIMRKWRRYQLHYECRNLEVDIKIDRWLAAHGRVPLK
jgi:hypothetical protein